MTDVPAQRDEIEHDRRHERFLLRILLVAVLAIGLFLLLRGALG